jgi:hypothetical protein
LTVIRAELNYTVDCRAEAHVEHPVGFVEDEHLDVVEAEASQANKKKLTADVLSLVSHSDRMFAGVLLLKQK